MGEDVGKLSALTVKKPLATGMYGDGDGLWLQVTGKGGKSWSFRFMKQGRSREMGLGSYDMVSLSEARGLAHDAKRLLHDGKDPIEERKIIQGTAMTFKAVSDAYFKAHQTSWRNDIHRKQWTNTLATYVIPTIGDTPVGLVSVEDVIKIIEPLWEKKTETASRIRGRIELVLDYATARGWRTGENPARWRGHLESLLPNKVKVAKVAHFEALPWKGVGAFVARLRELDTVQSDGLEFLILTTTRTNEVIGATWSEIDLVNNIWTIPAERMKADTEHRVPLSTAALVILEKMKKVKQSEWVFPNRRLGKPLMPTAFMYLLKGQMKLDGVTVHGFRSTFRDWVSEATSHQSEIAEAALAHTLSNKVEAAYRRGDMLEKRRLLMQDWANFIGTIPKKE